MEKKFVIIENLAFEADNDPKQLIFQDNDGDTVYFDNIEEAIEEGVSCGIGSFIVCEIVSRDIISNYDEKTDTYSLPKGIDSYIY